MIKTIHKSFVFGKIPKNFKQTKKATNGGKKLYTTHKMKIEKQNRQTIFAHIIYHLWKKKRSPSSNIFEMNIWNKRIFTLNHFTARILDDNDNFLVELKGIKELNWNKNVMKVIHHC